MLKKITNCIKATRGRWDSLETPLGFSEPGYIGSMPYLAFLRWFVIIGSITRFYFHRDDYTNEQWALIISTIIILVVSSLFTTYLTSKHNKKFRYTPSFIVFDIVLITVMYYQTGKAQSDFFLFYDLPIMSAGEFFSATIMFTMSFLVTVLFAIVVTILSLQMLHPVYEIVHVFVPREVFFIFMVMFVSFLRLNDQNITKLLSIQKEILKRQKERREKELRALQAVDRAIVEIGPNLKEVLNYILDYSLDIVGAEVGTVMWFNRWDNALEVKAKRGHPEGIEMSSQALSEGIIGLAAKTGEPCLAEDVKDSKWSDVYLDVIPSTRSELAVPLIDGRGLLGVVDLQHSMPNAFSDSDTDFLKKFAYQVVIAAHSEEWCNKIEEQIKPQKALNEITSHIQDPNCDLECALRLYLTGVTSGEGAAFSRAMLFLLDDDDCLQGKLAIGALKKEEAEGIWMRLDGEANQLQHDEKLIFRSLLKKAEDMSVDIKNKKTSDSPLSQAVQKISLPIESNSGAIAACIVQKGPVIVDADQNDPLKIMLDSAANSNSTYSFACVPLIGKEKIVGVLVVDHRFLKREKRITFEELYKIEVFAGMIAINVENLRLKETLEEKQRIQDWRSAAGKAAHILGKRVSILSNFISLLETQIFTLDCDKKAPSDTINKLKENIRESQITLQQFRQYVSPINIKNIRKIELNDFVKNLLHGISASLIFETKVYYTDYELIVEGDTTKLSNAFVELIHNSQEAMHTFNNNSHFLTISVSGEETKHLGFTAKIEFSDTGPGISDDDKKNIFKPFYTTKQYGTGLGLPIVREIIEEHKGTLAVGSQEDGAKFVIHLPVAVGV